MLDGLPMGVNNMKLRVALLLLVFPAPALAGEVSSAYTEINAASNCTTFAMNEEGGEFANFVCPGHGGYPVVIYSGDLRESIFYGFPPGGDGPAWESFSAFNSTGPRIEWRIETEGERKIPFATIHRWFVSDAVDSSRTTEVLVVEKVGQVGEQEGCAVGLVLASGNPRANQEAREVADEYARDFACGADDPVTIGDPIPDFQRQ